MTLSTDLSIKAVLSLYKILDEEPLWFTLTVGTTEKKGTRHISLRIDVPNYNHFHKILETCTIPNLKNTERREQE